MFPNDNHVKAPEQLLGNLSKVQIHGTCGACAFKPTAPCAGWWEERGNLLPVAPIQREGTKHAASQQGSGNDKPSLVVSFQLIPRFIPAFPSFSTDRKERVSVGREWYQNQF